MVGRELLTICPLGEDHQGDDRGGRTTGPGVSSGRGSVKIAWRSLTLTTMPCMMWGWIKVMVSSDSFLMSFDSLV